MRFFKLLALFAVIACTIQLATAGYGDDDEDDGYAPVREKYNSKYSDNVKTSKDRKDYLRDKTNDRGIGISSKGGVDLRNKQNDIESYKTRDQAASDDRYNSVDYKKSRGYPVRNYDSKPARPVYAKPASKKSSGAAAAAPAAAAAAAAAPAAAAAAPAHDITDGIYVENDNGNNNVNSEKSRQQNKAVSENANDQRQEKTRKRLSYKEGKERRDRDDKHRRRM